MNTFRKLKELNIPFIISNSDLGGYLYFHIDKRDLFKFNCLIGDELYNLLIHKVEYNHEKINSFPVIGRLKEDLIEESTKMEIISKKGFEAIWSYPDMDLKSRINNEL